MKDKITVIYDDTFDNDKFEETRRYLFDEQAEEENWLTPDDVPDLKIFSELHYQYNSDWEFFAQEMKRLLENNTYIITGTCGRWNGPAEGGKFLHSFSDLNSVIGHLDSMKIFDKNGHLYINGYHHDGFDSYEIKKLTKKGYDFARSYGFDHDRKLHFTIMHNNLFSALPKLSQILFGA